MKMRTLATFSHDLLSTTAKVAGVFAGYEMLSSIVDPGGRSVLSEVTKAAIGEGNLGVMGSLTMMMISGGIQSAADRIGMALAPKETVEETHNPNELQA